MRSFQVPRWREWVAGLHPPPVNWDVWKSGQHRHGREQLAGESVHGHHIRSPDCHDLSPSVKAFSGLQGSALIAHFPHRVVLRLFCVPRPLSPRLRWCGRLCVDTGRQEVVTGGSPVCRSHGFDTGCSAEAR